MNIFDKLKVYNLKWEVVEERAFTTEEINAIEEAEVVPSDYGLSVKFTMSNGGCAYIPLSTDAAASVGDFVNMKEARLLTLSREGSANIIRVHVPLGEV